jgi:biopolymer transport protein ExbD
MAMRGGGLKRKSKAASEIPSSSLADMAFLLLIFFMVSTTFRKEQKRDVVIPEAEATQKMDDARKDILHVFVERDGRVFINDLVIPIDEVSNVVLPWRMDNPKLLIVLRADSEVPYQYIDAVQKELQEAAAVRVTFYTNVERRMLRQRR